MTTQIQGVTFRYSHTIGRGEASGTGFTYPVSMVRGEGDLMYVLSRSYESRPDSMRITMCTVGEDYIGEFAKGSPARNEPPYPDAFVWPTSIALDQEGNVYVVDDWLNRVSIFTRDGEPISKWGTAGTADGQLNGPSGIAFDREDNLYLVDSGNNRIQKFTKDGHFLAKWGQAGSGDGEFNLPWGIDIDKDGNVYVADWRNDRIQKFTPDGQFLVKFGVSGSGDGEFNRPTGVAVDQDGIIYVTDWGNDRLQVFDAQGRFITEVTGDSVVSKWGKTKLDANPDMWKEREVAQGLDREKLFWGPIAVEVDDQGQVFVVESARNRVQVYLKRDPLFLGLYDGGRL
jgi:DNA-binding beta-propeller fold protein YncE